MAPSTPVAANTRKQAALAALDHVLTVVLEKDKVDDPEYFNWIAFGKIKGMGDLIHIAPDKVETTTYDNNGSTELPTLSMVANVRMLQAYNHFYCTNNNKGYMDNDDWNALTADEYCGFKTIAYNTYSPIPPNTSLVTSASPSTKPADIVADFKKGIKRDATHYQKLKDDSQWDNWNRDVTTTARAQNVENVLNPNYSPTNPVDKELFQEQQKFMYDVRAVKINEDNSFARTDINLTYDKYSELLLSAAENNDLETSHKKGHKSTTRGIYSTSIVNDHDNDSELDIDSSIDMIEANFSKTSSMPKTRWKGLPPEFKALWDPLDDESKKAIILGNINPKTKLPIDKSKTNRRPPSRNTRTRANNQHDIIRAFLTNTSLADQQDSDDGDEEAPETTEIDSERLNQFTQALLAFNASQTIPEKKASSPADIRSVSSQPNKKTIPKTPEVEVNEVPFNGNTYRLVKD